MLQKLKNHVLAQTFRELKGNPKWSICTEPLWFIPYSLFVPFQTLYMRKLGLTSLEIGTTLTVGFLLQMFFALIGGVITDKMGRRKATVIFDTLGWTVPCLIWAFSQNFWWFLAAAAVNAAFQITNTSWNCLFIEDCPPKHITNAFTLIQMCGMLSVFFSPLAVMLVGKHDVVPVMRWLYLIAAISMLAKFLLLYHFGGETQIGKKRMEETRNLSYFSMMKGYGRVFLTMIKSGKMRLVVYFMALTNIIQIATTNFFSLYVVGSRISGYSYHRYDCLCHWTAKFISEIENESFSSDWISDVHSQSLAAFAYTGEKFAAGYGIHDFRGCCVCSDYSKKRRPHGPLCRAKGAFQNLCFIQCADDWHFSPFRKSGWLDV